LLIKRINEDKPCVLKDEKGEKCVKKMDLSEKQAKNSPPREA